MGREANGDPSGGDMNGEGDGADTGPAVEALP